MDGLDDGDMVFFFWFFVFDGALRKYLEGPRTLAVLGSEPPIP